LTRAHGAAADRAWIGTVTAVNRLMRFPGARWRDPAAAGTGRFMRHVKLGPERALDAVALTTLIAVAYADMQARLGNDARPG
jgi:hypothetical protein